MLAFLAHDSPPRGDDESELRHLSKIWGPLHYYSEWNDIEAVAYEYTIVNQYSGAIIHGNLEIVLRKFGDPDDRIVLNLSGVPAGKRLPTVLGFWEYLRSYMTVGPWFDETGNKTEFKNSFIEKSLKSGDISFVDLVLDSRRTLGR